MKAKPLHYIDLAYQECAAVDATHVMLHMPGSLPNRIIPVIIKGPRRGTPCWTWNGDVDKPTLRPSILSESGDNRCHSWVSDGNVQFLDDCSHEFKGQTLELLEVE